MRDAELAVEAHLQEELNSLLASGKARFAKLGVPRNVCASCSPRGWHRVTSTPFELTAGPGVDT
jgi:hypothetical protein